MPVYEYHCECGNCEEVILTLKERERPQTCRCGKPMLRKLSIPAKAIIVPTGRQMALDSLNSRDEGFPRNGSPFRNKAILATASGLEEPPRRIW